MKSQHPARGTVLILLRRLTRMVGLIAFGRPDNSVISPKVIKSMFKATYYTFCTLTTPATVTRSMGLPADARAVKFFAATLFKSILTWQLRSIYRDLQKTRQPRHRRQLILTTEPLYVRFTTSDNYTTMTVTLHITSKAKFFNHMPGRQRTSKSLAAATATATAAAKHMLFCLPGQFLLAFELGFEDFRSI